MSLTNEDLLAIASIVRTEVEPLKNDINELKNGFNELKEEVRVLKEDVTELKQDVNVLKEEVSELKTDVHFLNKKISGIEVTLENETNKNIRLIAEEHTDLNRKLDESLLVNTEKELVLVRITHLENEVRQLKERINQIA